jgi:hypothetical protein
MSLTCFVGRKRLSETANCTANPRSLRIKMGKRGIETAANRKIRRMSFWAPVTECAMYIWHVIVSNQGGGGIINYIENIATVVIGTIACVFAVGNLCRAKSKLMLTLHHKETCTCPLFIQRQIIAVRILIRYRSNRFLVSISISKKYDNLLGRFPIAALRMKLCASLNQVGPVVGSPYSGSTFSHRSQTFVKTRHRAFVSGVGE